jgi:hypothetical protein
MIVKHSFSKVKIGSKTTISFFQNFNGSISNSVFVCTFANFGGHTSFRWSRQFVSESSIYTCDFGVEREFFRNLPSAEIKRKMIFFKGENWLKNDYLFFSNTINCNFSSWESHFFKNSLIPGITFESSAKCKLQCISVVIAQ